MNARAGATVALIMALAGLGAAQEIHLKTRNIPSAVPPGLGIRGMIPATVSDTHQLVQFDHTPSVEDLDALLAAGAQVVSVVPDNAVLVTSRGGVVPVTSGIRTVSRIDSSDKLSPALGTTDPLWVIVEFHADVSVDDQNAIALAEGITLSRPPALAPNHALAQTSLDALEALGAHDEVAYIFPADPALATDSGFSACAGMLTLSGPIAQFANLVHGWNTDSTGVARLGYVFGSMTTKAPIAQVESEILRALNTWSQHTNIVFEPGTAASAARTIAIMFASGAHGDAYPFDGPGGILAHTFYPVPVNPESIAGDMHLDADENWHIGGDLDVYSVALHEAGHAIGLAHSDQPGDVMYPYYRRGLTLSARDIGAAQALYGLPPGSAGPVTVTTSAPVVAPLKLTLNAMPLSTQSSEVSLAGTVAGGTAPLTVQWQTNHGYSGQASLSSSLNWTASGIALVYGSNTISVTVFDSHHLAVTQSASITLTAATQATSSSPAAGPVNISITTPSASVVNVNAASVSIAGVAGGGAGITKVTWQSSDGCSGVATGTTHWLANVPLLVGTNTVIVRAYDVNGANAWAAVVIVKN